VYQISLLLSTCQYPWFQSLSQVKERTGSRPEILEHLVRKLLMIVNRVARLLEIMHFDPEDFSNTISDNSLDKPTKLMFMTSSHMPYILNRLSTSVRQTPSKDGQCCILV